MTSPARPTSWGRANRRVRRAGAPNRAIARGARALERPEAPYLVLLAGFLAAGLFLRLDGLGKQSFWFDEADVTMRAQAPLSLLIRDLGAAGQNGPLYTLLLHLWTALFGTGEAVVRLPSALAGAAAIPLIYATGRAVHGPKLGLYAAGIMTVAPYQHWYAQEAKMYALAVCATLAATLLFLLALREDRGRVWIGYVVVMTLALYLHVTAALILAAHAILFLLPGRGGPRPSRRGWLAFAALTLPYLPVAAWELRFALGNTVTWHLPIGPLEFLRVSFTKFAVNRADAVTEAAGLAIFAGLALLGALPLPWRHAPRPAPALSPRRRAALLVTLLALPMALFYAVTLARPLFSDRYLIVVTPAFALLVSGGVLLLERHARALAPPALALILALSWVPLRDVNLASSSQKEDWRGAYRHIAAHLHPNDAILVAPGYLRTTFDYHALRDERLRGVPLLTVPDGYTDGTLPDERLDLYLRQATAGSERVWLILSPDRLALVDPLDRSGACGPDRLRDWYCRNARPLDARQLNGVWLGLYAHSAAFDAARHPPPAGRQRPFPLAAVPLGGIAVERAAGRSGGRRVACPRS
ncbi:MAG: glycosyltransferase family 39 protein [Chloroflexota bacterium]|nr:glycosyltransferase family 39 protein [Chloroflexota bacterium]